MKETWFKGNKWDAKLEKVTVVGATARFVTVEYEWPPGRKSEAKRKRVTDIDWIFPTEKECLEEGLKRAEELQAKREKALDEANELVTQLRSAWALEKLRARQPNWLEEVEKAK